MNIVSIDWSSNSERIIVSGKKLKMCVESPKPILLIKDCEKYPPY